MNNTFINYHNEIDYNQVEQVYFSADLSVFASTCETFGQIILESMASGVPIVCSNISSMSEILKDGGIYFNPLNIDDIESKIKKTIESRELRTNITNNAFKLANKYSWETTALKTFNFIKETLNENINS